ncbi:Protein TED1 [Pelomyxa schiedti]|nr:Protein TED1 [Pelomyxa schiedti]
MKVRSCGRKRYTALRRACALMSVVAVCTMVLWVYLALYARGCGWKLNDPAAEARILLVADPQIQKPSANTYFERSNVVLNDLYLRHIISSLTNVLSPTHMFVLGDLFPAHEVGPDIFYLWLKRYNWIFSPVKCPMISTFGNHDIGYSAHVTKERLTRFTKHFGEPNSIHIIAGWAFCYSSSNRIKSCTTEAWTTLRNASAIAERTNSQLIIFGHTPLHKETPNCEAAMTLRTRSGFVYEQNLLTPEVSNTILAMNPKFVFAGHYHTGCTYVHNENTTEYTVRSIMGDFGGSTTLFEIRNLGDDTYDYSVTTCPFVRLQVVVGMMIATGTIVTLWIALFFTTCALGISPQKRD